MTWSQWAEDQQRKPRGGTSTQGTLDLGPEGSRLAESRRDAFAGIPCARPGCGDPVEPQSRGGSTRRYCSRECQRAAWDERHPRVPAEDRGKQTRAEKILARLRQGPATSLELLQAGGGIRAAARIHELRGQGYVIDTDIPAVTGLEWPRYRLVREPVGRVEK